ncbi:MAG: MOSC N-terminal beta barrel domain-containing protein [Candidatus Acidiferrum sp.]
MPLPPLPNIANIRLHPIKSLDPISVSEARISPSGGLVLDRAWALYSVDGQWVNGKRTPVVHLIRANYSQDLTFVTLSVPTDRRKIPPRTFAFPNEHEEATEWFSVFFEQQIIVRYSPGGFPDDTIASGPTIVSTASLQAVSEWFSGLSVNDIRLRFRTTLEINGVPAFWEDQLFAENERNVVRFNIGEVAFEGSNPCARCPVPPRDPFTGTTLDGFQKRFTHQREATLPAWSPRPRFDHFYRLATNTRVASTESGKLLRVGDPLLL